MPTPRTTRTFVSAVTAPSPAELAPAYRTGDRWVVVSTSATYTLTDDTAGTWTEEDGSGGGGGGGPSPGGSVVDERILDHSASSAGASAAYSRADHTHGTPAMPSASDVGADAAGTAAAAVAAHVAAGDPHTQYQKESEKGAVNGYADLDGAGLVPVAELPTASTSAAGIVRLATPSTDTIAGRAIQASDTRVNYPSFPRTLTEDLTLNADRSVVVLGPLDLASFTLDLGSSVLLIL